MSIWHTGQDLKRINEIAGVLLKYGFTDAIRRFGLATPVEQAGKLVRQSFDRDLLTMPPARRLRKAMEEMGPTFVKLGQILATRVDMFPPDWISEFEKLQDSTPAIPFEQLRPHIEKALGKPIDSVFPSIDTEPLGTASIAQVHKAVTRRGEKVVLKIQKPGIANTIASDLRLLEQLARLAVDNLPDLRRYRPIDLVREFDRSLHRELDFTIEARNADRIRDNLRSLRWLKVPKVYWEHTSPLLQVQELIEGIPAKQLDKLDKAGMSRKVLAHRGAIAIVKMALEDGFFHADPHPGNFLILAGNRIAMLDYGMVGKLSSSRREQIIQIMRASVTRDPESCASVLAQWSEGQPIKFDLLVADVEDIISQYYGLSLAQLDITGLLMDITAMLRVHDLVLPSDIALLIKAIITLEGFGRLINPDFDVMQEAEPLVRRLMRLRYSPTRLARSLSLRALDAVDKIYTPPQPGGNSTKEGSGIDPRHLERLVSRLEKSQYRQMQALLLMTGLLSGTLMLGHRVPPAPFDVSVPGLLLFLGNGIWGLWMMLVARRHLREWD